VFLKLANQIITSEKANNKSAAKLPKEAIKRDRSITGYILQKGGKCLQMGLRSEGMLYTQLW
jgi:hypothetical protein